MASSSGAAGAAGPDGDEEMRITFFTRQDKYSVTDTPIAVPQRFRRVHLSQMVNHLLSLDPPTSFDFLINGEFLRTSLGNYTKDHGIFTEEIMSVEFIEAMAPPEPSVQHIHDDWIAAVAGHAGELFLTGSYDNAARVWNESGGLVATLQGHTDVVTSVGWIPPSDAGGDLGFVTGSQDESLRVWAMGSDGDASCVGLCEGHSAGVRSLSVQPSGKMFASGSMDKDILLWSAALAGEEDDADPKKERGKRRRKDDAAPATREPLGQLRGSAGAVMAIEWATREQLFSAGEDHCVRVWDVETATNTRTLTGAKVINDISYSHPSQLIASADFDRHVRVYDTRSSEGSVVKFMLTSHNRPVSSVAWSPTNEHQLVSGSHDDTGNNLKLWDVRSTAIPIHNVAGHEGKVLAVTWPTTSMFISGGEDGRLLIHKWKSSEDVE